MPPVYMCHVIWRGVEKIDVPRIQLFSKNVKKNKSPKTNKTLILRVLVEMLTSRNLERREYKHLLQADGQKKKTPEG